MKTPVGIGFIAAIFIIIALIFIFAQPKLSSRLFAFKRHYLWNEFLQKSSMTKTIDGPTFWEFREFYYPGYFTFERSGFSSVKTNNLASSLQIELLPEASASAFLMYTSDKVNSIEALVHDSELDKTIVDRYSNKTRAQTIVSNGSHVMYQDKNIVRILFVKPTYEMVKANGYFDFRDADDRSIIENKYWLNVTEIELD